MYNSLPILPMNDIQPEQIQKKVSVNELVKPGY